MFSGAIGIFFGVLLNKKVTNEKKDYYGNFLKLSKIKRILRVFLIQVYFALIFMPFVLFYFLLDEK